MLAGPDEVADDLCPPYRALVDPSRVNLVGGGGGRRSSDMKRATRCNPTTCLARPTTPARWSVYHFASGGLFWRTNITKPNIDNPDLETSHQHYAAVEPHPLGVFDRGARVVGRGEGVENWRHWRRNRGAGMRLRGGTHGRGEGREENGTYLETMSNHKD